MLASLERYHRSQVAKAEEDMQGVVEKVAVYLALGRTFKGDGLGTRANKRLEALALRPGYTTEKRAHTALARARKAFRQLPPAGRYAYNMDYSFIKDRDHLARRAVGRRLRGPDQEQQHRH